MIVLIVVPGIHKIQKPGKICSDLSAIVPASVSASLGGYRKIKPFCCFHGCAYYRLKKIFKC